MIEKNGTYYWDIDINLLKDLFVFFTVWKLFLLTSSFVPAFLFLLDLIEGNLGSQSIINYIKVYFMLVGLFTVLLLISYFIVFIPAAGVKYGLTFEMNNKGINHIVREQQRKKNYLFAFFGMTAGMSANNPVTAGANMIAYSRQNMYTPFKKVKKIVYYKRTGIIKLIGFDLTRNVIFTTKENSDMVFKYICEHTQL